jgi:hypothetical protein
VGPAAAQRHPGENQATVRKTDHGGAIGGIPRLSRPGLNQDIAQPATAGHQELQPAADSHHSHPAIVRGDPVSPLDRPLRSQPPARPGKLPDPTTAFIIHPATRQSLSRRKPAKPRTVADPARSDHNCEDHDLQLED